MSKDRIKGRAAYRDCEAIMDRALEIPGLVYELPSNDAAVRFRARCYQFRKLMLEYARRQYEGVFEDAETVYDALVIRMTDENGKSTKTGRFLRFDHEITHGKLHFPDGTTVEAETLFEETPSDD